LKRPASLLGIRFETGVSARVPSAGAPDFLIAEDAFPASGAQPFLRDFARPRVDHRQFCIIFNATLDSCLDPFPAGRSQGGISKAFSLMIQGTPPGQPFPTPQDQARGNYSNRGVASFAVAAIGLEQTAAIAFDANRSNWGVDEPFEELALGMVMAAQNRGAAVQKSVRDAFMAVGVLLPTTILNLPPAVPQGKVEISAPSPARGEMVRVTVVSAVGFRPASITVTVDGVTRTFTGAIATFRAGASVTVQVTFTTRSRGDVNGDGRIDPGDLLRVVQHLRGLALPAADMAAADVAPTAQPDGRVSANDLAVLQQIVRGSRAPLP
jgi:hypothetical protein